MTAWAELLVALAVFVGSMGGLNLAAQYESLTLPIAIILIVPMGVLAALTGVWLTGETTTSSPRSA